MQGKFVKILYKDGDRYSTTKGDILSMTDNFVELQTLKRRLLLNVKSIIKIEIIEGEHERELK